MQKLCFLLFAWLFDAQSLVFCKYIAVLSCIVAVSTFVYLSTFVTQNFAYNVHITASTHIVAIPDIALSTIFAIQDTFIYSVYYNACVALIFA